MEVAIDDERMLGEWHLIAATSGHLDSRPRIEAATVALVRSTTGRTTYTLVARTPRRTHTYTGRVCRRPAWLEPRTWLAFGPWLVTKALHGRVRLNESGTVAAIETPGSMLLESGIVVLARDGVSDNLAHATVHLEMAELALTPLSARELLWRIKAPGTDPYRFAGAHEI